MTHPWYGECDRLGPQGVCAECLKAVTPVTELEKTKMMLAAYQKAFNQIEDVMEYHDLTDEYFYSIIERLMGSLRQIKDK